MDDPRLLLLGPDDNVLVARTRIASGEQVSVSGETVRMRADLPLGHKLARRAIRPGEKVVKYGAPIGTATRAIGLGEHVHVHNLASDYTPSYTLPEAEEARA